ncbi:MAG: DUF6438 domain-containing protein [Candidatus Nanohalobium sp.]
MVSLVAFFVIIGAFLYSEEPPDLKANEDLKISLSKTSCLGNCPSYSVQITGNGSVMYEGLNKESTDISQDKVQRLLDKFYEEDFFKMKEGKYEMTDDSDTIITVESNGYSKSIDDDVGILNADFNSFKTLVKSIKNTANVTSEDIQEDIQEANPQAAELEVEYAGNYSGAIIVSLRNTGIETLPLKSGNQKNLTLYANGSIVGSEGRSWRFVSETLSEKADMYLAPTETVVINTSVEYPRNGSYVKLKINGPFETSDEFLCYNHGTSSC